MTGDNDKLLHEVAEVLMATASPIKLPQRWRPSDADLLSMILENASDEDAEMYRRHPETSARIEVLKLRQEAARMAVWRSEAKKRRSPFTESEARGKVLRWTARQRVMIIDGKEVVLDSQLDSMAADGLPEEINLTKDVGQELVRDPDTGIVIYVAEAIYTTNEERSDLAITVSLEKGEDALGKVAIKVMGDEAATVQQFTTSNKQRKSFAVTVAGGAHLKVVVKTPAFSFSFAVRRRG